MRARLAARRVVVVVGSGVSVAATRGDRLASWLGLLESGVERADQLSGAPSAQLLAARALLAGGSADWIMAAELVTRMLGGREGGEYARWLRESVGSLRVADPEVVDALVELGAPVATTNYDGLIEEASGWEQVTWQDGAAMQRALQGDDHAVAHLHGYWRSPRSVILGVASYGELALSGPAQALQRALATVGSLLLVGVGDGASDPNFAALRQWLATTFPGSEYRHYRLCLSDEVAALSREHAPAERIVPVAYGDRHEDLTEFLRSLRGAVAPRGAHATRAGQAPGAAAPGLPPRPVTIGRDDLVADVAGRLLAIPAAPVLLHGAPGVGKTNLTLAAAHSARVVGRFGARRWFVRCETHSTAAGLVGELARAVGVPTGGDALAACLLRLGEAPALVVLDNLETPWERDTLGVEEILAAVAAVDGTALAASLRGAERPGGVVWTRPVHVEPLDAAPARGVFLAIAPDRFDVPELDVLLAEMGGVPLAIELLAHAAEGEDTLAGLARRWREERTLVLRRGGADHRLLSIAVSIDTSWESPAMTASARRLLSVLGWLPDGVADADLDGLGLGGARAAANLLRRRGLVVVDDGRLRTLPPVRHHIADAHPPDDADWQRAVAHYLALAESVGGRVGRAGGGDALARLAGETANIAATVRHTLDSGQPEAAYPPAFAFIEAARLTGLEVSVIASALLRAAQRDDDAGVLARAHASLGRLALARSDGDAARTAYERAQPLYKETGDVRGEADCIKGLGDIAIARSDYDAARDAYEGAQPLYQQIGDVVGEANCIRRLGEIARARSDYDAARDAYERAQPLYQQIGDDVGEANCIKGLGDMALDRFDYDAARAAYERAQPLYQQIGHILGEANCIARLGEIALRGSDFDSARVAFEGAQPLYQQIGNIVGEANCIAGLGDVALERSDHDAARAAYERALELYTAIGEPFSIGQARRLLARLEDDQPRRRGHVSAARAAWSSIARHDLVAALDSEFDDS